MKYLVNEDSDIVIEKATADVDDYSHVPGEFDRFVYFLEHEWYDGEYDYETCCGHYSTRCLAEQAMERYRMHPDLLEHPEGFFITPCVIDSEFNKLPWSTGFFTWG